MSSKFSSSDLLGDLSLWEGDALDDRYWRQLFWMSTSLSMNVVHMVQPILNESGFLVPLKDGYLPNGARLVFLNDLSKEVKNEKLHGIVSREASAKTARNSKPNFHHRVKGICLVALHAKCRLADRGGARRNLMLQYLKKYKSLDSYGNIDKRVERFREVAGGVGIFDTASSSQRIVSSIFAPAAKGLDPNNRRDLMRFQSKGKDFCEEIVKFAPDNVVRDAFCSVFDFSSHDAVQLGRTIATLQSASCAKYSHFDKLSEGAYQFVREVLVK